MNYSFPLSTPQYFHGFSNFPCYYFNENQGFSYFTQFTQPFPTLNFQNPQNSHALRQILNYQNHQSIVKKQEITLVEMHKIAEQKSERVQQKYDGSAAKVKENKYKNIPNWKYFSPDQAPLFIKQNNQLQKFPIFESKQQQLRLYNNKIYCIEEQNNQIFRQNFNNQNNFGNQQGVEQYPFIIMKNVRRKRKTLSLEYTSVYKEYLPLKRQVTVKCQRAYEEGKTKRKQIVKNSKWKRQGKKVFSDKDHLQNKLELMKNYVRAHTNKYIKKEEQNQNNRKQSLIQRHTSKRFRSTYGEKAR